MKQVLIKIVIFIMVVAILAGTAWFFLMYRPDITADLFCKFGSNAFEDENYNKAVTWYRRANKLMASDQEISVHLAEAYRASGNYTKAEYTLSNAIAQGGSVDVYLELCRVYVEQDKLLDAVNMLDQIGVPEIKAQLDAQRPSAPTANLEPGFYSQYMDLEISAESGTLYVNPKGTFPSTKMPYSGPISLPLGESNILAVAVNQDGLVSPLSSFGYTIGGVVESVTLADPALDAYVRELLSRSEGSELTTADLWSIEEMDLSAEIADLSDLRYFTGLKRLTIQPREALDLSFLSSCTNLESLTLSGCPVNPDSLPLIGGLSKLTTLNMAGCGLSTVSGLETLTTLTHVDLSKNIISDLSPLSGNTALTELNLQGNALTDISPVAGFTELTRLILADNSIKEASPLGSCVKLQQLDIRNNSVETFGGLGNLVSLISLDASSNKLPNVGGIGNCTALEKLDLSKNALESMDGMVSLVNLVTLDVSYNNIHTIPEFSDSAALSSFNGCHNFFEDVSGLAGMNSLNNVYLDYNNITDINVLASCPNLIQVNVFHTNVTDISALQDKGVTISYDPT